MQRTFHVSTKGDDGGDGTKRKPFATLARAVEASRALKRGEPRRIVVHGGIYYDVAVELSREDEGLIIEGEKGKKPVLVGGRLVQNWKKDGKKFYAAELEGVKEGKWDFRMLLVNGRKRARARLPEKGYFRHQNAYGVRFRPDGRSLHDATQKQYALMNYRKGDLGPWLDTNNAEVTVVHVYSESRRGIKSLDGRKRLITFTGPCAFAPGHRAKAPDGQENAELQRYYVSNVREGMLRPGQWYLDRTRGKLVYWPKPNEDIKKLKVIAPTQESIIYINAGRWRQTRNITIRGLTLTGTTAPADVIGFGAFKARGALTAQGWVADIVVEDLVVKNVGGHGIKICGPYVGDRAALVDNSDFAGKAARIRVADCELKWIGGGGIIVAADESVVTNNLIQDVGEDYRSIAGIQMRYAADCEISHNEISGSPYNGISANAMRKSRVINNCISRYMLDLQDGAAIYVGGGWAVTMSGNVVVGGRSREWGTRQHGHAYYNDSTCVYCVTEKNLAVNTCWPNHNMSSTDCVVRNNVFVDKGEAFVSFPLSRGMTYAENIVYAKKGILVMNIDAVDDWSNNIFYSEIGKIEGQYYEVRRGGDIVPLEAKDGTIFADPGFKDVEAGDYRLKRGSPARKLGIKLPDFSKAGRMR